MTESVLVGRNDELTMLAGHLDRAIQGSASICMVTGEPGAGKSSLLTRLVTDSLARHPQLLGQPSRRAQNPGSGLSSAIRHR
jgi:predicted ATP-dependent serine protease